jgi:L-fuculose-phosphate aldolase
VTERTGPAKPAGSAEWASPRRTGTRQPAALRRLWADVVATARGAASDGLVVGTSGNVSARTGDLVLVTPTGVPYERLGPHDIVGVDLDGHQVVGESAPTSELPMHLAVYRHTDARAVVHTHAVHATAVSTLVDEVPAIHYIAGALGGPVRVAGYALYGTDELAAHMLTALRDRTACLLRNHGTVAHGTSLAQAYDRTAQLEWMCRLWLTAASVPGRAPALLSPEEMRRATEKLRGYGQRR